MIPISKLLEKKLRLYVRKVSVMGKINANKPHYILSYKDINALGRIIRKEIIVNKRLLHYTKVYAESRRSHLEPFVVKFEDLTRKLILTLRLERKVLRRIGLSHLMLHELGIMFFSRPSEDCFDNCFSQFIVLYKREQELDAQLFMIVSQEKRDIIAPKVRAYKSIAKDLNTYSKALLSSVGNSALVRKNAQELLRVLDKVKSTELYSYMHGDIVFIKNQIKDVIRDPRKSKVKTVLAAIYMFTPGTFDTTVYILLLKNLTKVTMNRFGKRKFRPRAS